MNRIRPHAQRKLTRVLRPHTEWWAAPVACLATLLALPVNAGITIPDDPLTTGNKVAPNILFILDDSGSMALNYMPDSVPKTSAPDVSKQAYPRNTLFYNPAITYYPWMQADGNRMANASYSAAYGSFNLAGGTSSTIDLGDSTSCKKFNHSDNSTTDEGDYTEVCGGVQTYYVPMDTTQTGSAYLGDGKNYYRYQIKANGSDIQRAIYGTITNVSNKSATVTSSSATTVKGATVNTHTVTGQSTGSALTISVATASDNNSVVDFAVMDPSGIVVCSYQQVNKNSSKTCLADPAVTGVYKVSVRRTGGANSNATYTVSGTWTYNNSCDNGSNNSSGWINCTSTLPNASRSLAQELVNYANWFSFHRTRTKAAKYGASDAFKPLGNKVRVGFRTIWGRDVYPNSKTSYTMPIPVNDGNDGRFVNNIADPNAGTTATTTRNDWYATLQGVISYDRTPLHGALENAGKYFSDGAQLGAYGPQDTASQYSCRQNFTILTTDGYWNDASKYSGKYSDGAWSGGVGEQDNADGSLITGPKGKSYTYNTSSDRKWPYVGNDSGTLADVAMKYWKTDLRTDAGMTNNVPTTADDPAFWQHMVTFGISIGMSGTRGWTSVDDVKAATTNKSWPNPNDKEDADRIDDLLHAAVNGHGQFVAATSPERFSEGLSAALATIAQRTSSYSNVATNSTSLNTGAQVFSASYTSGIWTGKVTAQAVDRTGVSGAATWTASIPAFATRKSTVFTYNGSSGTTFPTTTQSATLARTGGPVDYPVTGDNNANYIMGDQSGEGSAVGKLRVRTTLLGDIVGSSPAYVLGGATGDGSAKGTLYVGANDGMLHAFNAADGKEIFAYVPNIINFNDLAKLSRGDYDHKWFVDGPIAVTAKASWNSNKNILVGSLGKGGKGLYALDVTNPSAFSTGNVKWEKNDGKLGLVLGAPVLAKVRGSSNGAVVVGNGPNSADDKAYLVVRDLSDGSVIREIPTDSTTSNGLFAPTGIYAADGQTLVYAYAGDMQGNVWKFDMTNSSPAAWTATKIFHAEKTAGTPQPITSGLALAIDPKTNKRWVFFGTGRFMTTTDADDKTANAQSMYAFMDDGGSYTRNNLKQRKLTGTGAQRTFDSSTAGALSGSDKGWYLDLPGNGERIVQDTQIERSFMLTASMIPEGDACEASGTGYINAIDAFTGTDAGGSLFDLDGDGKPDKSGSSPVLSVNLGVGMPTRPVIMPGQIVVGGSGDGSAAGLGSGRTLPMSWQRVSWREIRRD